MIYARVNNNRFFSFLLYRSRKYFRLPKRKQEVASGNVAS